MTAVTPSTCFSGCPRSPWQQLLVLQVNLVMAIVLLAPIKQARMLPPLHRSASDMVKMMCLVQCQVAGWLREATLGRRYARPTARCFPELYSPSLPPATPHALSRPHQVYARNFMPETPRPLLWEGAVEEHTAQIVCSQTCVQSGCLPGLGLDSL